MSRGAMFVWILIGCGVVFLVFFVLYKDHLHFLLMRAGFKRRKRAMMREVFEKHRDGMFAALCAEPELSFEVIRDPEMEEYRRKNYVPPQIMGHRDVPHELTSAYYQRLATYTMRKQAWLEGFEYAILRVDAEIVALQVALYKTIHLRHALRAEIDRLLLLSGGDRESMPLLDERKLGYVWYTVTNMLAHLLVRVKKPE